MTASKRRRNHPSILQVPSISSLFSVLPRAILGKTQRNKTCQSSAISPHNQPISREYPLSLSTSFSVYFLRSSYERTREGSPSLESSHSSTSLAMNEGLTPGSLSFADHLIKCQYTKDHLMIMYIAMTISFSALPTGKPEWREPRSTSPFLPSRSV